MVTVTRAPKPWSAVGPEQHGHVATGLGRGFLRILPVPGSGQQPPLPWAALIDPMVPLAACLSLHPAVPFRGHSIPSCLAYPPYAFLPPAQPGPVPSHWEHALPRSAFTPARARAPADSAPPLLAAPPSLIFLEPVHALYPSLICL